MLRVLSLDLLDVFDQESAAVVSPKPLLLLGRASGLLIGSEKKGKGNRLDSDQKCGPGDMPHLSQLSRCFAENSGSGAVHGGYGVSDKDSKRVQADESTVQQGNYG